jgi:hypothetical protein
MQRGQRWASSRNIAARNQQGGRGRGGAADRIAEKAAQCKQDEDRGEVQDAPTGQRNAPENPVGVAEGLVTTTRKHGGPATLNGVFSKA